jgi:hypothetical protein
MPRLEEFDQQPTRAASSGAPVMPTVKRDGLQHLGEGLSNVGKMVGNFMERRQVEKDKNDVQEIRRDIHDVWIKENPRLAQNIPKDGMVTFKEGAPTINPETGELFQDGEGEELETPITHTKYVKDRFFEDIERRIEGKSERVKNVIRASAENLWINRFNPYHAKAEVHRSKLTSAENYDTDSDRTRNALRKLPSKTEMNNLGYTGLDILDENIRSRELMDDNDSTMSKEEKSERNKKTREEYADAYVRRRMETDPEWIHKQLMDGKLDKYLSQEQLDVFIPMSKREAEKTTEERKEGLRFHLKKTSQGAASEVRSKGTTGLPKLTKEDFLEAYDSVDTALDKHREHEMNMSKAKIDHSVENLMEGQDIVGMSNLIQLQRQRVAKSTGDDNILQSYALNKMMNAKSNYDAVLKKDPAKLGRSGAMYNKVLNTPLDEEDKKRALDSMSLVNQTKNGVPTNKLRILTTGEADYLAGLLSGASLFSENGLMNAERGLIETFDQHPGQESLIMRQLIEDYKISPRVEALVGLENPVGKQHIRTLIHQFKNPEDLKDQIEKSTRDELDAAVLGHMKNFNLSTSVNPTAETGRNLGIKMTGVVKDVAYLLKYNDPTLSVDDAAEKAYKDTIGAQYTFINWNDNQAIRVPVALQGKDSGGNPIHVENPHGEEVFATAINSWLDNVDVSELLVTSDPKLKLNEIEERKQLERIFMSDEKRELEEAKADKSFDLDRIAFQGLGQWKRAALGALQHTPVLDIVRPRAHLEVRLSSDESRMEIWSKDFTGIVQPVRKKDGTILSRSLLDLKEEGDRLLYTSGDHPAEGNAFFRAVTFSFDETIEENIDKSRKEIRKAKGQEKEPTNFSSQEILRSNDTSRGLKSSGIADDETIKQVLKMIHGEE